ncbi:tetratricopeptide repeat protein [Pseudomonas fildesensis]|uniref:Type III secretion protein n=1 Tax=Pseudomonas fildesensis TaxID=1674920 RepID=A0A0J8G1F4_9PSED|nr:type III secretion protein [Pseudomonas fildesensis]KMT54498.1 type III secretion protein [Pseudomonas fildesensis]
MRRETLSREEQDAVELLKGMGELYRRGGQAQKGLVMLLIAVHLAPRDPMLLRGLAMAFTDSAQPDRALSALDRLVAAEGESPGVLLLRSRALWGAARKDEARQCFKRYLAARRAAR